MNFPTGICAIFNGKKYQKAQIIFALFFIFYLNPFSITASHIVGGELSYNCLGGNTFEIKLTVYRDCFYGSPNAEFDPEASIGIFDANNELVLSLADAPGGQLLIPATVDDTLDIIISDPCLFAPQDICVHSMTYIDTIALPPIAGGYQMVYQRCCRNSSISNIISSFDTGASFVIDISETALLECNSSPQFSAMPPLFLCINEPFVFDQSVIDVDGDSLVYSLCTPLDGASFDNPRPQPPLPPPYDPIIWQDPPYDLSNLLGGAPLEIDPLTGVVTAIPNTQGIFLVGMCIQEYRNGELISETRREFQYNVGLCSELIADFEIPEVQCENLTVEFENTSINATEYLWVFNDSGNPNATSTEINPVYTFSGLGNYTVMLIADPNSTCADTTYNTISLINSTLEADFSYVTLDCTDSVTIALIDQSFDTQNNITDWLWTLSDGQTSTEQSPFFTIDSSQTLEVVLLVTSSSGCQEIKQLSIQVNLIPSNLLPLQNIICKGDTVQLNPNPPNGFPFSYSWSPDLGLSQTNIASPLAFPEEDITYTLIINDTINNCSSGLETKFEVLEDPNLSITVGSSTCMEELLLIADTDFAEGDYIWSTDISFDNVISDSASVIVSNLGETTYYVQFSNEGNCFAIDSITVVDKSVNVQLVDSQLVCVGDIATFSATNLDPNDNLSYQWFNLSILSTNSILELFANQPGESVFYFQAANQFGCIYLDSVTLNVLDDTAPVEIETTRDCDNLNLVSFTNLSLNANYYQWIIDLPSGNDTLTGASISYEFPEISNYSISLIPIEGLPCTLPLESFEINLTEEIVLANFEWNYIQCENEIEIQFTDLSTANQGNIISWEWTFGNNPVVIEQNPILNLNANQELDIELIVFTDEGCSDTISQTIEFSLIDVSFLVEEVVICDGNSVILNPLGNPDLNYEWFPSSFLDDANAVSPIANPPVTTLYTVIISDPNGNNDCEIVKTVNVIVPDEPVIANFDYEVINCNGNNITLSFIDNSTPANLINNWFYSFSNGQVSNNPNTILTTQTGTELIVQFQVQTLDGCTDIFIDTIEIEPFSFDLPQNEIIKCSGLPVNLNPGGNPNYTYLWSPAATLNDAESPNPIANPIETTEYCVTVTNGDCIEEACVTVLVPDVPLTPDFSYQVSGCIDEAIIQFNDESQYSLGNIIEWNWTFSNGETSNLENPSLVIDENTNLEVTLEVLTSDGCEASIMDIILINLIEVDLPNQIVLCEGNPVQLNPNGNPNHNYSWSPSTGLTNDDVASPFAFPLSTTTYTVEINDGACEIIQTIEVIVPTTPLTTDFSFTVDDCTDIATIDFVDNSSFAPGQIVAWNWQFSNGDSANIENPSIVIDQSQALEVSLEVMTNNGCIGITSQTLDINLIDINIQDTIVDCTLSGVELNPGGNPTYNYQWSPGDGISDINSPNPLASPISSTLYTVTVSDGVCELTRSVEVIVPDDTLAPGFTFIFDDCTDNAIIEFTDTTVFNNNSITSWDWTFTGSNTIVSDLQNPIITLNESETILAELIVTSENGCSASASQEVEVNLIDINVPGSIIYCSTQGITLNPGGNPDYLYNWSPSTGLSGTDVPSPYVSNLTQTTNYFVTVTNGNCTLTRGVEILVPDIPLQADFAIDYLNCLDSAIIQLNDQSVFSGNIIEWEWLVNMDTSILQNPIFTFDGNESVDVQLIITTAHGCRDTLNTDFEVDLLEEINLPQAVASCNGNGVFLNPDGNPDYLYHWSPNIGLGGDTLNINPLASPDSTITYSVLITNPTTGCVEEESVIFNVPTNPLMAGFDWELVSCADSAIVEFIDTSSYSGTISEWEWIIGSNDTIIEQNPSFVFGTVDTIEVNLIVTSDDGCIDSISNPIAIDIIEIETIQDTIQLCSQDSVYLNPNGNPDLFYNWSPASSLDSANFFNPLASPTSSTEYSVTITSPNNIACNEVRKVNVLVPTNPIDLNWDYPTDTIICNPSIELIASSSNAIDFIWSDQADFQNILSTDPSIVASPNNMNTYYLQVSDDAGCTLQDSIQITSYAILANLEEEVTICYGDSIQVEVNLNPLNPTIDLQFEWSPEEGIVLDNNTGTPVFSPVDSTEYTLVIENQFGCEFHDTLQVNVVDILSDFELVTNTDTIVNGELTQLLATENPNWIYNWTPCDESIEGCNQFNPYVAPEETTTYYVEIEDVNLGCIYKDSITIFVKGEARCAEPYVFVPKAFTPNEDGLNDQLFVRGNSIEEINFVIFNRWGEKVFESKNINEGWDGKVNGKSVPPDVFGYYVEIKCFGGEEYVLKGNVTLIR